MKSLLYYLLQVILVSGILYAYYHLALRNKKFHRYNRFYLLAATITSLLVPFLNIPVYFTSAETNSSVVMQTLAVISSPGFEDPVMTVGSQPIKTSWLGWQNLSWLFYILIGTIALVRVMFSLLKIRRIARNNPVEELDNIRFVNTAEPGTPFSFFRWLFWNKKIELRSEKGEQIFRHELFHIQQRHSWDIIYMELLTVLFWINPFFHLIKKEIKAIHEFLADKFAVTENKKWEYAELLLMQALNTQQGLVNPFFHNQIKRRIAMITTSSKPGHQYLRKLMVLPIAAMVVALFAFSYRNKKEGHTSLPLNKQITVVIDAGHGVEGSGNYNGARALDGGYEDDIVLSIARKIKELNTNENIKLVFTREDKYIVDLKTRTSIINAQHADLFLSLHCAAAPVSNGMPDNPASGIEIYISRKNTDFFAENRILSRILLNYFAQVYQVQNKVQQREAGIFVLDNSNCPSALIECGYVTNKKDLNFIRESAGQEKIATSILQAIETYASQKEGPDWEERRKIVSDTTKPDIQFHRNGFTGKMEGSIDGKKIKEINLYKPGGQFALVTDDGFILISKEKTADLKKEYGSSLNEMITTIIDKENSKIDTTSFLPPTKTFLLKDGVVIKDREGKNIYLGNVTLTGEGIDVKDGSKPLDEGMLFIVDGKERTDIGSFYGIERHLNPADIHTINIVKGSPAISRYGEKGKNGVIEIRTKKNDATTKINEARPREVIDNIIFDKVEIEPSFPGGVTKWKQYLERNANGLIPVEKGAPEGVYTVIVQFIVDKEGNLHDIKALTNHGFEMEEEAIRVIAKGPKWVPALQNGHIVTAYKKQKVTFVVTEEDAPTVKPQDTKPATDNKVFDKAEIEPSFPGGVTKWRQYLERYANGQVASDSGAPAGTYTVIVQFIVDKEGSLHEIKALTKHGFGMEEEAIRVISKGPKWVPAMQNGRIVTAYRKQPVTFVVTEEDVPPVKPKNLISDESKDYSNLLNWNIKDPEFMAWRTNAINEVIAIARTEGKAAYEHKGRTYVFAKIDNPNPKINTYTEQDGLNHHFVLNGILVNSIQEINKRYTRENIKKLSLISKYEAADKYNLNETIVSIETFDAKQVPTTLLQNLMPANHHVSVYIVKPDEGRSISSKDFKLSTALQLAGCDIDYKIISFLVTIDQEKGELREFRVTGNQFNSSLLETISKLERKTYVTVEDIIVEANNKRMKLDPRIYTII